MSFIMRKRPLLSLMFLLLIGLLPMRSLSANVNIAAYLPIIQASYPFAKQRKAHSMCKTLPMALAATGWALLGSC
jgi:hypothetical protein